VSKFTEVACLYMLYASIFHILTRKNSLPKIPFLAISHSVFTTVFALSIHNNNLLISELLAELHCKTLGKNTGN